MLFNNCLAHTAHVVSVVFANGPLLVEGLNLGWKGSQGAILVLVPGT